MIRLLHIAASPRKQRSASREVAQTFMNTYERHHPGCATQTLDLWRVVLPEFDEEAMGAKYAGLSGTPLTDRQQTAWNGLKALASGIHDADILVLSVPLWNFGVPYKLKHFIDLVTQKDILFSFDDTGFKGLLQNKRAVVVYARGLDYNATSITPAERFDLQKPYVDMWLDFIGIDQVHTLTVEKTLFGSDTDTAARHAASARAEALARQLA